MSLPSTHLHPVVVEVTERISVRSRDARATYLDQIERARALGRARDALGCSNLAHTIAACGPGEKTAMSAPDAVTIGRSRAASWTATS